MRVRLFEESERIWQSIFTTVNNSLVYIDDNIAEILHWSRKTLDMTEAGAVRIQSIESGLVSTKPYMKAYMINKYASVLYCGNFVQSSVNSLYFISHRPYLLV